MSDNNHLTMMGQTSWPDTDKRNPLNRFALWWQTAKAHLGADADAMTLSTVSEGRPRGRILYLREQREGLFIFYTNYESDKGRELEHTPFASLTFFWGPQERQVRVEGRVSRLDAVASDAYFAARPRESQIGAWASQQSRPIDTAGGLPAAVAEVTAKFAGQSVPRPPHWGGFALAAERIEFWQAGAFRLHERDVYRLSGAEWMQCQVYP